MPSSWFSVIFFREKMAFFTTVNTNIPLVPTEDGHQPEGTNTTQPGLYPVTAKVTSAKSLELCTREEAEFSDNHSYDEELISSSSTLDGDTQAQSVGLECRPDRPSNSHVTCQTDSEYCFDKLRPISEVWVWHGGCLRYIFYDNYWWLSARLTLHQCVNSGITAVLH